MYHLTKWQQLLDGYLSKIDIFRHTSGHGFIKHGNNYDKNKSNRMKGNIALSADSININKKFLEVYIICPYENKNNQKKNDCKCFFEQGLSNLDQIVTSQPIFLDKKFALRYGQAIGSDYGVLRAYVSEEAIQSYNQELLIKSGYLSKNLIHGCYPGWAKGRYYVANPDFGFMIE